MTESDQQQQQQKQEEEEEVMLETTTAPAAMMDEEEGVNASESPSESPSNINNINNKATTTLNGFYPRRVGLLQTFSLVLNAGLMIYAHVGLSAKVFSSQPPLTVTDSQDDASGTETPFPIVNQTDGDILLTGRCNLEDYDIWANQDGQLNRTIHSDFCSRRYQEFGCFLDEACLRDCFQTNFGYTIPCSTCLAEIPTCSFNSGCGPICAADSFSTACSECNGPCVAILETCLGFPELTNETADETDTPSDTNARHRRERQRQLKQAQGEGNCLNLDQDKLTWYPVFDLTFVNSIERAWNGNARFLAIIIIVFSGIWPYAKNVVLVWAWYYPMSIESRTSILTWLLRLSKYTLVDVFALVSVLVGVLLELNVGGTQVATRAEPRPAILAFFFATVWEFVQIEWVVRCHNRYIHGKDLQQQQEQQQEQQTPPESSSTTITEEATKGHLLDAMRFRTKLFSNDSDTALAPAKDSKGLHLWVWFLWVASAGVYTAGATMEIARFTSFGVGDDLGCKRSYNLVTFGNAMVGDLALNASDAKSVTWILYIAYMILVVVLPITVHVMQLILLCLASMKGYNELNRSICHWTSSLWGFASIEVLLIGIYAVEAEFEKFVEALAGDNNAEFFSITSTLGPAFFVLIVYGLLSGLLQYFLYCATAEYYLVDPYHKVHVVWTRVFGCFLDKKSDPPSQ